MPTIQELRKLVDEYNASVPGDKHVLLQEPEEEFPKLTKRQKEVLYDAYTSLTEGDLGEDISLSWWTTTADAWPEKYRQEKSEVAILSRIATKYGLIQDFGDGDYGPTQSGLRWFKLQPLKNFQL